MTIEPAQINTRQRILDEAQAIISRRGYTAVGISEFLKQAQVPKGSFYHWFSSKDAFGVAVIENYFTGYLRDVDEVVAQPASGADRLFNYWQLFYEMQSFENCLGKCLVVKLGAEVADLSESMRLALIEGTNNVVDRIERMIRDGIDDGSLTAIDEPRDTARTLYDSWIGASVLAKIARDPRPLDLAMQMTRERLR
ncbi:MULTISPECIES: TetR/AcrR family transcriptional regulator [Streptomyces]|jgi:TetR/AcrR family transcriptional repressor of nem operon|uniref:TetR/AcrR family transcriptional regulator n=1 Tax=Streptomyces TaxID=1883 RepID=UPI002DDAE21B|nr:MULTISPECIES: TetR/AcrR family transcriptional regulator [unclassified Streptomyces]WSE11429.1 TetR/AcrR family transcriptional regulator [Streptomyces sp. NBC_01445]